MPTRGRCHTELNRLRYWHLAALGIIYKPLLDCLAGAEMALSIKTAEADELARSLARLTGETMTDAVTAALRERLARERARREADISLPVRLADLSSKLRAAYDTRPITRAEWDAAAGDEGSR